jgi:hypothetical protein
MPAPFIEKNTPTDGHKRSWTRELLLLVVGVTFAAADILHHMEIAVFAKYPVLSDSLDWMSKVSVVAILIAIGTYLVDERVRILEKLPSVEAFNALRAEVAQSNAEIILRIGQPEEIRFYRTQEETYAELLRTIARVEATTSGLKEIRHAILHGSASTADGGAKPEYLMAFDKAMTACVASHGANRWDVRQFYNITTLARLDVVMGRLHWGTEGYDVRAVLRPDLIPSLSPLIIGEEDAFLGIVDSPNYRVGTAVHLHGKSAATFVVKYFDELWDYADYKLKNESGINVQAVDALKAAILRMTQ